MDKDSPVAALLLKLKKKPEPDSEEASYDVDEAAAKAAGKKLRTAIAAKDDMGVYDAVCNVLGLKGLINHGSDDE